MNLFAYSGGSTLAAAVAGAEVCHLDASRGMVRWARENAALNGLNAAPIRWIVEDVNVFLDRELKRGRRYDAIILDPPTYGHGRNEEVYKLESELLRTLEKCWALLSAQPAFMLLTSHTAYCTPVVLENLIQTTGAASAAKLESGEMLLEGDGALPLPSGTFVRARF
ncbi:MAG: Ribosomal RNA large subunit methyltransferase K [Deltaproteobacteria bacterium ADurb.Bin510]|nr:MAG: Ribosomal RNA large subunit methyltransferase K [Deltaproteobacteria bacterium ADurb.Bin510]